MSQLQYLLDTNIISEIVREPKGQAARKAAVNSATICTSILVACELHYGVAKRGSARLAQRIDQVLQVIPVLSFTTPSEHEYAKLRDTLTKGGRIIGPMDLLIGAHALSAGLIMVTANIDEFQRVPGLPVENWL